MRADAALSRFAALGVLAWATLAPSGAGAEGIFGTVQFQYQRVEDWQESLLPDSTRVLIRTPRELMTRTFDFHNQSYVRPELLIDSNLRFSDLRTLGRPDQTRSPLGSVRLIHPWVQLTASHMPTTTVSTGTVAPGTLPGSAPIRTTTSRFQETALTGHLSRPRWPQVDLAWTRRRREGEAGTYGDQTIMRNARVGFDRERFGLYAAATDQHQERQGPGAEPSSQLMLNGGGVLRMSPAKATSFTLQYDAGGMRSRPGGGHDNRSLSQSAGLTGEWRPAGRYSSSLSYQWRRADQRNGARTSTVDQEGALLMRAELARAAVISAGGGLRTVRLVRGQALQKYATAVASLDGRVRPGWTASASASHTDNWDPDRRVYGVETASGATRMQLGPRAQLEGSWQVSANNDTATQAQRYSVVWGGRTTLQPLRTLTLIGNFRTQRLGPALLRPTGVSRGSGVDVQWRPLTALDLLGSWARTVSLGSVGSGISTRTLAMRFEPSPRWQLQGSWTRSEQALATTATGAPAGSEIASGRLQYMPTRRLAASAGLNVTDPGRARETRAVDAVLTWSFGR